MKDIRKGQEPRSLTEHRNAGGDFDDAGPWKSDLQRALLRDQGEICCYCMRRIDARSMKIEHLRPQQHHASLRLSYRNLLAACTGSERTPSHDGEECRHCDSRKGSRPLSIDPVAGIEHRVVYRFAEGRITSDDPVIDSEFNEILGLNVLQLQLARRAVIDGLRQRLSKKYPTGGWKRSALERELARWSERDGERLRPFCQVAVAFLRVKLRRSQRP